MTRNRLLLLVACLFVVVAILIGSFVYLKTSSSSTMPQSRLSGVAGMSVATDTGSLSTSRPPSAKPAQIAANVDGLPEWLIEYATTPSLSDFFNRHKNAPPESGARYLAEVALQRCAFIALLGAERFGASKMSATRNRTPGDAESIAYKKSVDDFANRCKGFTGTVTSEEITKRHAGLQTLTSPEAAAERITLQIAQVGLNGFRAAVEPLLSTSNPVVVAGLGLVWDAALKKDPGKFSGTLFESVEPEIASAAWRLAACNFGWDCSTRNDIVADACINGGKCLAESLTDLYQRYLFSPTAYTQVTKLSDDITLALRSRNWNVLRK